MAAARLGGRLIDISRAVEAYVRSQPHPSGGSWGSSRSTSATASAPRCTRTRRSTTTSGREWVAVAQIVPGLALAVEPMVNLGGPAHPGARRRLDRRDPGRPRLGPLRAHVHGHRGRPVGADRARRRPRPDRRDPLSRLSVERSNQAKHKRGRPRAGHRRRSYTADNRASESAYDHEPTGSAGLARPFWPFDRPGERRLNGATLT